MKVFLYFLGALLVGAAFGLVLGRLGVYGLGLRDWLLIGAGWGGIWFALVVFLISRLRT